MQESSLAITLNTSSLPWQLSVSGRLDETARFPEIDFEDQSSILVNLRKLNHLSSSGILLWSRWVKSLPKSVTLIFEDCPAFFVTQLGTIEGMAPNNSTVRSFFVPYYDAKLSENEMILFVFGKQFNEQELLLPLLVRSEESRNELEIDVEPKKFFRFLTRFFPKIRL